MTPVSTFDIKKITLFTQFLVGISLLLILNLELLPALLAGFLIYQIVEFGSRVLVNIGVHRATGRILLVIVLGSLVIASFVFLASVFATRMTEGPESIVVLLQKMADVVDTGRSHLPVWIQGYLPANIDEWQVTASAWLRENAKHFSIIGRDIGSFLFHVLAGMLIGGMVALNPGFRDSSRPLSSALQARVKNLSSAFRRIVFSQIRISALNTMLTGIFLVVILPVLHQPLPLTKTMIAVTFIAGLLPIVGNLISNTVIFLIALSVSTTAAVGSLIFLVVIHKLEYFINARIIGTHIRARAWEILLAMLVMESAFGIIGLVAAPIYYAYLKDELTDQKLI